MAPHTPSPPPSLASKIDQGWARSRIIRPQESLVLYKSFSTLWIGTFFLILFQIVLVPVPAPVPVPDLHLFIPLFQQQKICQNFAFSMQEAALIPETWPLIIYFFTFVLHLCWIRVQIQLRWGKKLRFHNTVCGAFQLMRINENPELVFKIFRWKIPAIPIESTQRVDSFLGYCAVFTKKGWVFQKESTLLGNSYFKKE